MKDERSTDGMVARRSGSVNSCPRNDRRYL